MRNAFVLVAVLAVAAGCKKKNEEPAKKPVATEEAREADGSGRKDRREPRHEDSFPRNKPGPPTLVDAKVQADAPGGKKIELSVQVIDGWLLGGGIFKPAEADTIWFPRIGFEAIEIADLDSWFAARQKKWEVPNTGTGKAELDDVRQKVDVVEEGALEGGKFRLLRVNKPAAEGPYPNLLVADCVKKRPGESFYLHAFAWAPVEAEKTELWPLLVKACKTMK